MMAWPDSADAVIASAEQQTINVDTFSGDILAGATSTLVTSIQAFPVSHVPDPAWVDPGDGSQAPQIPDTYDVRITFTSRGVFGAAVAEKLLEVRQALGLAGVA